MSVDDAVALQPADPTFSDQFAAIAAGGRKIMWIVSSGGHLVQATHIERLIGINDDSVWITNDVPQAHSLLAGRNVVYVDYVAPRDWRGAIRTANIARKIARDSEPDQIVSTGAAIAGVALPRLALAGYKTAFVESVARKTTHSLTGKIAAVSPRVTTFTQYPDSATRRWKFGGTILANWKSVKGKPRPVGETRGLKILVTLGTIRPYRFDAAVDAVLKVLEPEDDVVWQLGETTRENLPGTTHESMTSDKLNDLMRWADVIVSHAGVGTIVDALDLGKSPVVLVRSAVRGEHVDDHQVDIATELERRDLGSILDVQEPRRDILFNASQVQITRAS